MKAFITAILCLAVAAAAAAEVSSSPATRQASQSLADDLRPKIKTWSQRFPYLRRIVDEQAETSSEVIKTVTNRGFLHYSQQVALQAIEGVEGDSYDPFVQYMLGMLEIPSTSSKEVMENVFLPVRWADNSDWMEHTITFSLGSGATKHVCILGHRNEKSNTYDFVVADFKTSFQLAPDILIVTERKSGLWGLFGRSKTRIEKVPASLTSNEIDVLTNFFDLAAFARFAKMLDVSIPTGFDVSPYLDPFSVLAIINAGVATYTKIAEAFKTKITNRILKEVMGQGFDYFSQTTKLQVLEGIRDDNMMNSYLPLLPRIFKLNGEEKEQVEFHFEVSRLADTGIISDGKFLFNIDKVDSKVRYLDVIIARQREEKNPKFNVIVADLNQEFKLAPNIVVMERSRSIAGGIYEDNKITFKKVPRSLTEKDVEMLMNFFHITVYKRLAGQYNVKVKYPDPKINM